MLGITYTSHWGQNMVGDEEASVHQVDLNRSLLSRIFWFSCGFLSMVIGLVMAWAAISEAVAEELTAAAFLISMVNDREFDQRKFPTRFSKPCLMLGLAGDWPFSRTTS